MDTKKTTQFDKYTDDNIWTVFESEKLYTHDVAVILIEDFSIIPNAVTLAQSTLCKSGSEFYFAFTVAKNISLYLQRSLNIGKVIAHGIQNLPTRKIISLSYILLR